MVEIATLITFASVMFLVVVELSGRVANSDFEKLAELKDEYYFNFIPDLGFLSFVHFINVFVLMAAHLTVSTEFISGDELIVTLLYLGTLVFLIILPYIEIGEYDMLLEESDGLSSWEIHILMCAGIMVEPYLFILLGLIPSSIATEVLGSILFFGIYLAGASQFLDRFQSEIQTSNPQMILDDY